MLGRDGVQRMVANEAVEVMNWTHQPAWLSPDDRQIWMDRCVQQINWDQPQVRVYGRWHRVPRLTAFLADQQVAYRYSGAVHRGEGWPDWFRPLLDLVSSRSSAPFNGCLFNLYRDGQDRMGWHADDEFLFDGLRREARIVSLSLCGTSWRREDGGGDGSDSIGRNWGVRKFQVRRKGKKNADDVREILLGHGDLMTMEGLFQKYYL